MPQEYENKLAEIAGQSDVIRSAKRVFLKLQCQRSVRCAHGRLGVAISLCSSSKRSTSMGRRHPTFTISQIFAFWTRLWMSLVQIWSRHFVNKFTTTFKFWVSLLALWPSALTGRHEVGNMARSPSPVDKIVANWVHHQS